MLLSAQHVADGVKMEMEKKHIMRKKDDNLLSTLRLPSL